MWREGAFIGAYFNMLCKNSSAATETNIYEMK
jgi:hypothetical protein